MIFWWLLLAVFLASWILTSVIGINVFWLFPLAVFAGNGIISGAVGVVIAYSSLILIAVIFNAGVREEASS